MERYSPTDELYMRRCLQLAKCGAGSTSPNPMVGAVIVCAGKIIGEGYHIRAGEPHAEVNAVRSVAPENRALLAKSTIYVSLEPCSHYGKTPPCCDLIISCGIPRVVIGIMDPNPLVGGAGIERMRAAGIEVVTDVLRDECYAINEAFFTIQATRRPKVTLKWAQSADGYIDLLRDSGSAVRISTPVSQVAVHKLRACHDAIMVGRHTALLDNPSLNIRHWAGRAPLRLVIDGKATLSPALALFDGQQPTIVYTARAVEGKYGENVKQVELDFDSDVLPQILDHLGSIGVNSLLVEGGATTLQSFINAALWDDARVEVNPSLVLGDGVAAPALPEGLEGGKQQLSGNEVFFYRRQKSH